MKQKTYAIGDIHGNIKALEQALARAPIKEGDMLIFLGDYGDGFNGTPQVVDRLLALKESYECVFLLGNHDMWVQKWFETGDTPLIWTSQGGQATIDAYVLSGKFVDPTHKDFWSGLETWVIKHGALFVHGGWEPVEPFFTAAEKKMNNGHYAVTWDRSLMEGRTNEHTSKFKSIFVGHTATKDHLPFNHENIWGIDTGAGWDGKLTIMDVDTKQYWQSDKNAKSGR